ncbi:MAG: M67 family metallopeptidase [Candidatus Bathyarchaeia archaeon]
MVLKILRKHLDEIFKHAEEKHPIEACGILVGEKRGQEKVVRKVYHTRNLLASPSAYQIDPLEQLRVFEEVELAGLDVVGFYHSHPLWDAFWSEADEEGSKHWVGYSYLIVSLKTGKFSSYIRREEGVETEEVVVI